MSPPPEKKDHQDHHFLDSIVASLYTRLRLWPKEISDSQKTLGTVECLTCYEAREPELALVLPGNKIDPGSNKNFLNWSRDHRKTKHDGEPGPVNFKINLYSLIPNPEKIGGWIIDQSKEPMTRSLNIR